MPELLTISIPTYNRISYLQKCLQQLLPQAEEFSGLVRVLVTDNCSTDGTEEYMRGIAKKFDFVQYHRNDENKGYSGNQINCISMPRSVYTAILCDDDLYLDDALDTIMPVLQQEVFSFVALNYYGFKENFKTPVSSNFAPSVDKIFSRAYDLMNYPSVGHYSGLIFNTAEAQAVLNGILENYNFSYYEQWRGVIFDIACRQTSQSKRRAYFIGKRILANFEQNILDYDSLPHLCIEYYKYFLQLFEGGIINKADLDYRKFIVQKSLPRRAFSSLCNKNREQVIFYWTELNAIGLITSENRRLLSVIFGAAKYKITRGIMQLIYTIYRMLKK